MKLARKFWLSEFVPTGAGEPPRVVLENLTLLAQTVLQPLRDAMDGKVIISSGWRPEDHNEAVGGEDDSDHLMGRAADFWVPGKDGGEHSGTWEDRTIASYHWIRDNLPGCYGQVILEDHRLVLRDNGKLWVHVATVSARHPGTFADPNRVLVSYTPRVYRVPEDLIA